MLGFPCCELIKLILVAVLVVVLLGDHHEYISLLLAKYPQLGQAL